jgi:glycine cleavage system H protein
MKLTGGISLSTDFLELLIDKFVFKVKKNYLYSKSNAWAQLEGNLVRVGITDFKQQTIGDVAFIEFLPDGTELSPDSELAQIETIKVVSDVLSPVGGSLHKVNEELEASPELINEDPYGQGWLVLIKSKDWNSDRVNLMTAETYLEFMRQQAEAGMKQR